MLGLGSPLGSQNLVQSVEEPLRNHLKFLSFTKLQKFVIISSKILQNPTKKKNFQQFQEVATLAMGSDKSRMINEDWLFRG